MEGRKAHGREERGWCGWVDVDVDVDGHMEEIGGEVWVGGSLKLSTYGLSALHTMEGRKTDGREGEVWVELSTYGGQKAHGRDCRGRCGWKEPLAPSRPQWLQPPRHFWQLSTN